MPNSSASVKFHYIKGNFFRVSHADGAIGNITPAGLIFVGFYSERAAIPQMMVHEINNEGQVGNEFPDQRVAKEGIVRELDVGTVMSVPTAKHFVRWLNQQIEIAERLGLHANQELADKVN